MLLYFPYKVHLSHSVINGNLFAFLPKKNRATRPLPGLHRRRTVIFDGVSRLAAARRSAQRLGASMPMVSSWMAWCNRCRGFGFDIWMMVADGGGWRWNWIEGDGERARRVRASAPDGRASPATPAKAPHLQKAVKA